MVELVRARREPGDLNLLLLGSRLRGDDGLLQPTGNPLYPSDFNTVDGFGGPVSLQKREQSHDGDGGTVRSIGASLDAHDRRGGRGRRPGQVRRSTPQREAGRVIEEDPIGC